LKLVIELLYNTSAKEERLLYLTHLDEQWCDVALANKTQKKCVKAQYYKSFHTHVFLEGDIVLFYDKDHDKLGKKMFEPLLHGPYIIKHVLKIGAYELVDYDGNPLSESHNRLYLRNYYS
jgi:hypothetical protein